MGLVDWILGALREGLAGHRGATLCASCVRPGDGSRPGIFGDYGLCPRCNGSVTSKTKAFFVPHGSVSIPGGMDCESCAVCREPVSTLEVDHRCSRLAIQKVLALPRVG